MSFDSIICYTCPLIIQCNPDVVEELPFRDVIRFDNFYHVVVQQERDKNELLQHFKNCMHLDDQDDFIETPLHWAAGIDNEAAIEVLFTLGADLEAKEINQMTPLMFALAERAKMAAKALILSGAQFKGSHLPFDEHPLISQIVLQNEEEGLSFLANSDFNIIEDAKILSKALLFALSRNKALIVKHLLERFYSRSYEPVLLEATCHAAFLENEMIFEMLLNALSPFRQPKIDKILMDDLEKALKKAVVKQSKEAVRFLEAAGAPTNAACDWCTMILSSHNLFDNDRKGWYKSLVDKWTLLKQGREAISQDPRWQKLPLDIQIYIRDLIIRTHVLY